MNRTHKTFILTIALGLSVGAGLAVYRSKSGDPSRKGDESLSDKAALQMSMSAKKRKERTKNSSASGATDENASQGQSSMTQVVPNPDEPTDEPKPFVSLEQKFIADALKRPILDRKEYFDAKTGAYVRASLVKDDGQYGYLIIRESFTDKAMTESWTSTAQIGDQLLVRFEEDKSPAELEAFMKQNNLTLKKKMLLPGSYVFVSDAVSIDHMKGLEDDLTASRGVTFAEPNFLAFATLKPNDPRMDQLWGFENVGKSSNGGGGYSNGFDIKVTKAWDSITDCTSVPVAVLDTGVDYNHPDLKDNMDTAKGRNFIDRGSTDVMDRNSHGTHCAGSIAAVGNNGVGVAGVCWKAKIIPIKVLSDSGSGSVDAIADGIVYAAEAGAKVLSISLGGGGNSSAQTQALEVTSKKNVLLVAAAGNDNRNIDTTPFYPAALPHEHMLVVGASNGRGQAAGFSNFGEKNVDIVAPGEDIMSTVPNNGYRAQSGTSMATPITAGVAVLLWSAGPKMTALDVKKEIMAMAEKGNFNKVFGGDRKLNAEKALGVLQPKASLANAATGDSITLINEDMFEFQVKNENPYTQIKSVEIFNGTVSLGKADGEKVIAKLPLGEAALKLTAKITDSTGKSVTTSAIDVGVDINKAIDLSAIDVSANKGDVTCSFTRTNAKMEKTTLFEAKVDTVAFCKKLCRIITPTAFASKANLSCVGTEGTPATEKPKDMTEPK